MNACRVLGGGVNRIMLDRQLFSLPGVLGMLVGLCLLTLLRAAAIVGQAWFLATAIDALRATGDLSSAAVSLGLFLACFIARQLVVLVQDRVLESYAFARVAHLRQQVLARLFREGPALVSRLGTGNAVTLVLEGAEQVETYLRLVLPKIAGVLIVPLVLLLFAFPLDWVSGLIMLIVFPFIVFYMVLLGKTAKAEADKQHDEFNRLANHFVDTLRGIDTLKLFGRSRSRGKTVFEASERLRRATMKTLRTAILSGAVLDLFSTFSLAAVAIMLGFRLVDGTIAFFPALVVLIMVPEYFKPIREYASDYHASLDGKTALASMLEAAAEPAVLAPAARSANRAPHAWSESSVFQARDVSFAYEGHQALHDVSFEARGFSKVGIVGASGSGKSTLVNLLGGFAAPSSGGFHADLACPEWQKQLVYIPQDPYLFHASLRENIAFYRPDADEGQIEQAVRAVGLEELVQSLPQGLDTLIGEGARALSGGQAQRIALARALLDPSRRILLFDEPTAHLDIETELELKERMLPLMEGHLVFFATHRLHWIHDMDVVLVLEDGRIAQWGAPDELLSLPGALTRLFDQLEGGAR